MIFGSGMARSGRVRTAARAGRTIADRLTRPRSGALPAVLSFSRKSKFITRSVSAPLGAGLKLTDQAFLHREEYKSLSRYLVSAS